MKAKFYPELESLRGVAALMVVLVHIPPWSASIYSLTVVRNSYLMVDFFFVLSGFVIMHSYGSRLSSAAELKRFACLRLIRLYPVHLLFLLVFLGFETIKLIAAQRHGAGGFNYPPFRENSPAAFLEGLFLVQGLGIGSHALTYNFPSWSISTEFYTYLLFGGLCCCFCRRPARYRLTAAVLALGICAGMVWIHARGKSAAVEERYFPVLECLEGFFLGTLLPWVVRAARKPAPAVAAGTFGAMSAFLIWKRNCAFDPVFFLLSALLIAALASNNAGWFAAALRSRPLTKLGAISYSLYMCHAAVIWVVNATVRATTAHGLLLYPLTLAACIAVAAATHRLVEKPSREFLRQRLGRREPSGRETPAPLSESPTLLPA